MKKSDVVRKALENWRNGIYAHAGICYCLQMTQNELSGDKYEPFYWYEVISKMTGDVCGWLNKRGICPTESKLREYRELWLEHLLNYYLEQGE